MSLESAEAKGDRSAEASFLPGQLVDGKYRVERLLGVGGMAAVWSGTNERTGKRVALKVVLRALASRPATRELFYSEGLVASRINHPNVVTIFDVIEHEGSPCIVMELLDGEPLSRLIERKGFLSVQETTWLLLPAMRGVAAAHAQGVIHRDLKPQNVFLCVEPSGRIVTTKVLDFGISVLVERVLDLSRGLFVGTPNYMSPEHVAGVAVIDGRADVYGFGLLLYEALTGQIAFPGEPGPELFHAIMNQPPPSLTTLRPDVSSGMANVIAKAMAKQPDRRFASLNAMMTALEVELLTEGLGVPSPSALPGPSDPGASSRPAREPGAEGSRPDTKVFYQWPVDAPQPKAHATGENPGFAAQGSVSTLKSGFWFRLSELAWTWRWGWKAGMATFLGMGLGILVWNAARPARPHEPVRSEAKAPTAALAPVVLPLASPGPDAEPAAVVATEPEVTEPLVVQERPEPEVEPKKVGRIRSAMVASAARARLDPPESVSGKSRTPTERASPEVRSQPSSSPAIRAGTLSADDF